MDKYMYLILAIVPLVNFIYGMIAFRKKRTLYIKAIISGVGCIALERIFEFAKILTESARPEGFHIGILSLFGTFGFFLSANFGQIDTLCDDGTKKFRKYRYIALSAPIFIFVNYFLLMAKLDNLQVKVAYGICCAVIGFADYYHLKLLLLPDVDFGIAKCLRPFNFLALIYSLLCIAEVFISAEVSAAIIDIALHIVMAVISGLLVPVAVRGVKKWTI